MTAHLDQLDLVAKDVAATVAFYRLLGVKLPKTTDAHHVTIQFAGGMELAFDSQTLARAYNKGYRGKKGGGNVVIGFAVRTRRAVDQAYARLTGAGHAGLQRPMDAFWGARYAIVADPDGNHVGIMSPSDPKKRSAGPAL
ncbi:MAG TPA: VOC family protein [Rhizomicrobium sp.]|nr:VOC family protein [Rhizomicrobium sp.]